MNNKELQANGNMQTDKKISELLSSANGTLEDLLARYLNDFAIEDDAVIGYINEFETFKEIMEKMKIHGFAFSVRDSEVRDKQRVRIKKNMLIGQDQAKGKKEQSSNLTVFFQLRAMPIKFFGMPFTIEKTTHYHCAYGCKYYKSKAGSSQMENQDGSMETKPIKKKKKVGSKKMGCLAKMTIKHITVYPEYELYAESDWRKKKMLIENLRRDLSDLGKTVVQFQRFYLSVSLQSSHNHPPIITVPKPKVQKKKTHKLLVKCNNNKMKKISNFESSPKNMIIGNNIPGEWCYGEMATSSLNSDQEEKENSSSKVLNLQDENFFHTLVKFPSSQAPVYEQIEYKPDRLEIEMSSYEQNENTQTIEVYEYQPTVQDLQTLFKEKLKRLYTLCNTCSNGSLLLRLSIDLEQIEVQLNNDVNYINV